MFYFIGDRHGRIIDNLPISTSPGDYTFFLGDIGIPWGVTKPTYKYDEDMEQLLYLNNQPGTHILILGNHDDYNWASSLPEVEKFGTTIKQAKLLDATFRNIYVVDTPNILTINNKRILAMPGAESHDIQNGILDPDSPDFEEELFRAKCGYIFKRIKGWTWWPQEKPNIDRIQSLLLENDAYNTHFDYILTHDCPGAHINQFSPIHYKRTDSEKLFDTLSQELSFDKWLYGHMHQDTIYTIDNKTLACLFSEIYQE